MTQDIADEFEDMQHKGLSRRKVLQGVGVGVGAAWAAPMILTTPASAAGGSTVAGSKTFEVTSDNGTETGDPGNATSGPGGQPCQFGGVCKDTTSGTATVTINGASFAADYVSLASVDYSKVTVTGSTFSAPATATVTLTSVATPADSITKAEVGTLSGGTAGGDPHTFSATFTITGGTGAYAGASGSGIATLTDNGSGTVVSSTETGTIVI